MARAWQKRFDELMAMERGWFGDPAQPGERMDPEGMRRLRPILAGFFTQVPVPGIFPWVTGTLNLEWPVALTNTGWRVEAEVNPATLKAEFIAVDMNSQEDVDLDVDLSTAEGRAIFTAFVRAFLPPAHTQGPILA